MMRHRYAVVGKNPSRLVDPKWMDSGIQRFKLCRCPYVYRAMATMTSLVVDYTYIWVMGADALGDSPAL